MTVKQFKAFWPLKSARVGARRCGTKSTGPFPYEIGPFVAKWIKRSLGSSGLVLSTSPGFADIEAYVALECPGVRVMAMWPFAHRDMAQRSLVNGLHPNSAAVLEASYKDFMKAYPTPSRLRGLESVQGYIRSKENMFGTYLLAKISQNGLPDGKIVDTRKYSYIDDQETYESKVLELRDQLIGSRRRIFDEGFSIVDGTWVDHLELRGGLLAEWKTRKFFGSRKHPMVWFHDVANTPLSPVVMTEILAGLPDAGVRFLGIVPAIYLDPLSDAGATFYSYQAPPSMEDRPRSELVMISDRPFQAHVPKEEQSC